MQQLAVVSEKVCGSNRRASKGAANNADRRHDPGRQALRTPIAGPPATQCPEARRPPLERRRSMFGGEFARPRHRHRSDAYSGETPCTRRCRRGRTQPWRLPAPEHRDAAGTSGSKRVLHRTDQRSACPALVWHGNTPAAAKPHAPEQAAAGALGRAGRQHGNPAMEQTYRREGAPHQADRPSACLAVVRHAIALMAAGPHAPNRAGSRQTRPAWLVADRPPPPRATPTSAATPRAPFRDR